MPATRPETWLMLQRSGAETLRLLNGIGRGLYERVDPIFVADRSATADYLSHMRWMAFGLGFAAERVIDPELDGARLIVRLRDAATLAGGRTEPALAEWLDASGVTRLDHDVVCRWSRGGGAVFAPDADPVPADAVILADGPAIARYLTGADRHRLLALRPETVVAGETPKPSAGLVHWLDRQVVVHQRGIKGPLSAAAGGEPDKALPRIAAVLGADRTLHRAGQSRYLSAETVDNAPLIGRMGPAKATVLAGFGAAAPFLAPAIARYLVGASEPHETPFFAAREVARAAHRRLVADQPPPLTLEPVS